MKRVLLVEPAYRNKYPPLGLMKLSTYHKLAGDYVQFVKGCDPAVRQQQWDRVYIATLFTFFWRETENTIRYYLRSAASPEQVIVGGVLATLLGNELTEKLGIRVIPGLLDKPGMLDAGNHKIIDHLIPDYKILDSIQYSYGVKDAYIGYATRGCPNACGFCAVRRLEPDFVDYVPLARQVKGIESVYGPKQDLLLLDNNVLASRQYERIIHEIIGLGFGRGEHLNGRQRRVDFNQGIDARLMTRGKMQLLAQTAIKPVRMAFDSMAIKEQYVKCIKLARNYGLRKHSTYVLYNYCDTPKDFYTRLRINVVLNEELGMMISSFPMRYVPLTARDRTFVGKHWTKRLIRGVQCILLATRGMVSPRREFFEAAFGRTYAEFLRIALMPEEYIVYRRDHEANGAYDWGRLYDRLGKNQREAFVRIVADGKITRTVVRRQSSVRMKQLLRHYVDG